MTAAAAAWAASFLNPVSHHHCPPLSVAGWKHVAWLAWRGVRQWVMLVTHSSSLLPSPLSFAASLSPTSCHPQPPPCLSLSSLFISLSSTFPISSLLCWLGAGYVREGAHGTGWHGVTATWDRQAEAGIAFALHGLGAGSGMAAGCFACAPLHENVKTAAWQA